MKFSEPQKKAFGTFGRDLCVLAGAGSGKTSVLVERFLRAVTEKKIPPADILAITFTDKAAAEMKSRLVHACAERGLDDFRRDIENATLSTIHAFCARLLKENPIESGLDPFFRVLTEGEADILAMKALDTLFEREAGSQAWMEILSEINESAARESIRKCYDLYRATGGDESLFQVSGSAEEKARKKEFVRVARSFQSLFDSDKRALSALDFDDLLFQAHRLLSSPSPACRAVRERYRKRFALILVDEYQDVSPLQDALVDLLKSKGNLFIVGDIQQSIYGFRHADPHVFRRRSGAAAVSSRMILSENYRSRSSLLGFVNVFFTGIFPESDFLALQAKRSFKTGAPVSGVELLCLPRDKKEENVPMDVMRVREARRVTAWIEALVWSGFVIEDDGRRRPVRYGDIAVLFRAAPPARFYEKEFAERGLPYETVKGKGFYEKPEIEDLVNLLKLIENPEEDLALAGVLRSPLVGASDDALYWLAKRAKAASSNEPLYRALEDLDAVSELAEADRTKLSRFKILLDELQGGKDALRIGGILSKALSETDGEAKLLLAADGVRKVANVRKFLETAERFEAGGAVGVGDFTRYLAALSEGERPEPEAKIDSAARDAVVISTIHAVKGLEFPVVVIADMGARPKNKSRGAFLAMPGEGLGQKGDESYKRIASRLDAAEEAEEWRLLYVAMTRAKEKLLLSGSLVLNAKDGDYKKEGSWMNRLCAALGTHPARFQSTLDFKGIEVGMVNPEMPPVPARGKAYEETSVDAWPADFSAALASRIDTKFKSYEETHDLSVTDLLELLNAGKERDWIREEEKPESNFSEEEGPTLAANEYGTLFHRFMEHLALKKPARLSKKGYFSRLTLPLIPAESKRLWEDASRFWAGPWGKKVRQAALLHPELPFIYKTPGGLLKGQIDLVMKTAEGRWIILDYKTGAVDAETVRFQLELYWLVFRKLYGELPEKGVLYFSSSGRTVDYTWTEADASRIEEKLNSLWAGKDQQTA